MSTPGHVIAVVGGKGGVGKSVFTANLALAWLQNFRQRPLIVDLDLNSLGDQNIILGQNPPKSIVDVSRMPPGPVDPKTLAPFMLNAPQGYSFIASPRDAILARDIDADGVSRFLKAVPSVFNVTFVDCGNGLDPLAMRVFEYATAIFVVTTADVIVINQTRRVLAKIQELLFPPEMVQVVVNRFQASSLVTPQAIEKTLGKKILAAIPDEPATADICLSKNQPLVLAASSTPIARAYGDLARKMQQMQLLDQLAKLKKPTGIASKIQGPGPGGSDPSVPAAGGAGAGRGAGPMDAWTAMKIRLHKGLIDQLDMKKMSTDTKDPRAMAVLREKTGKAILDLMQKEDQALISTRETKSQMLKEVLDEALGLGPLEDMLADEAVTEIMVNARDQIYVEKAGKPTLSKVTFTSESQMMNIIERIVAPINRRIDEKVPFVDARLGDGSRVHIIIPPLALRGPTITIRKFPKDRITPEKLVGLGSMTQEISDFLKACVVGKLNIVVSGGTGSGKTTLLNVLSNHIPDGERIITVEDSAELQLAQAHVVRLETRPKNIEGEGEVSIRDLIKCCLRMRPERIVVGECRGGEALDMLQAMSTGHAGSLTTVHANNPRECLGRLETLCMQSGLGLPSKAIKENIASAVNLIIQQSRLTDGSRKIMYITEITGMQGDVISLQDIFLYKQEGFELIKNPKTGKEERKIKGRFVPTGFIPKFVEEMEAKGMKISRGLFQTK